MRISGGFWTPIRLFMIVLVMSLAGCGDSDNNGASSPPTLSLILAPQAVKLFHFSWQDVTDETEYRLLENPDGVSGYSQVATIAADATSYDLSVFLPARINAQYILQACNGNGCSDSAPVYVAGTLAEAVGYVKASNTDAGDTFSYWYKNAALSADGTTLVVGASEEDSGATGVNGDQSDNSATDSGAVYVFTRIGSAWSQQAYIKASNAGAGDLFGRTLALSANGNTLAVGAREEDSSAIGIDGDENDNLASSSGAVYVFTRSGGVWTQQAYVKASNTQAGDRFGSYVAISGDGSTLAVGAREEDSNATGIDGDENDNLASSSGAVYVFTRSGGVWTQQAYVKASNTGSNDMFGYYIALSGDGNTLAATAYGEDSNATGINGNQSDNSVSNSGAAYVFTRSGGTWSQQAYIKASNTGPGDEFGVEADLAVDGNTLVVGSWGEDSSATGINGNQADNSATDSGAVYVFTRSGSAWSQQAFIKASNTGADDRFGDSVSLSSNGNSLAVGAWQEDSNATGINGNQADNSAVDSGAVYVFTRSGSTWSQLAYVKASNTGAGDNFGVPLYFAGDGNTLAVGASNEDSSATGINGDQMDNTSPDSGAVYLF